MMDGDGRQQDMGADDLAQGGNLGAAEGQSRPEGRGEDRHGGGAFNTDRSDKAVDIQSIVSEDDYAGSSESGV